jgi:phosphoribosylamine--glycine ligase
MGNVITGLYKINDSILFNAGTKLQDGNTVSNGGRVIAVTSFGKTISEALAASYKNVKNIHFDKMNYREDLGKDLMEGKE